MEVKPSDHAVILDGGTENARAFSCVLTYGATRMLWFHLTRHLFPEQARRMTALVATAPLSPIDEPGITTHVTLERREDGLLYILGASDVFTWTIRLDDADARRLWAQLDRALHPVGWQGGRTGKY